MYQEGYIKTVYTVIKHLHLKQRDLNTVVINVQMNPGLYSYPKDMSNEYLRKKCKCPHSKNGLFCKYCRFDSAKFLKRYKSKFDT